MSDLKVKKIRADFPILRRKVYGVPLVYFDNGATTQKPRPVIDIINNWLKFINHALIWTK